MRKQRQQVEESTMTEGVSVIRSAAPKKRAIAEKKKKLRVAAYCRVSKDIEQQESSMETQMDTYDRLISQHPDWELVEIYADKGKTGTNTKKRLDFNRMIDDAKAGKIDLILVKSISRFSRNTVDMLATIRSLRELGVGVYFEKENINTSGLASELLLTVFAAFAQEESFSISENMRKGIRQRFKLGIPKVSQVYGYDNFERGVLSINEEKAVVVRRIYDMYINGSSTTEIAKVLNEEGVLPPIESGKEWYPTSVKCILQNEKYVGDSLMQKYYTASHLEHDSTPNKELAVEQYYKEDTHPALVERDVYEDANRIIMMRDCKRGANQYPYYGRLLCPHCGKPMVKVNTGHGKIPSCWVCGGEDKGELYAERTRCPIYWVKEPYISNSVIQALLDRKVTGLAKTDAKNVRWVQEQLGKKKSVEFGYLKKLVKYINFQNWDTVEIGWNWGDVTTAPYRVKRITDYPDQTIRVIDGEQCIGPFRLESRQYDQVKNASEQVKQVILNTRIIQDKSHRFACPPLVQRSERVGSVDDVESVEEKE